jgi:hypothetical protein
VSGSFKCSASTPREVTRQSRDENRRDEVEVRARAGRARACKSPDLATTDYGYILHLEAPGGEETVVPNFRCFPLAVGDSLPYGGQNWVVTDIHLRLTDTTSFEVWAKPARAE